MTIQQKRRITASDNAESTASTNIAPEATDLLFEAEDVAELVAEVTGEAVEVTADENTVTFTVGDTEFVAQAEGDEEVLESVRIRGKRTVAASTNRSNRRFGNSRAGRTVRKVPSRR